MRADEMTLLFIGTLVLSVLVLLAAFVIPRITRRKWIAIALSFGTTFVVSYVLALYLTHGASGASIWHIVVVSGVSGLVTWVAQKRSTK